MQQLGYDLSEYYDQEENVYMQNNKTTLSYTKGIEQNSNIGTCKWVVQKKL